MGIKQNNWIVSRDSLVTMVIIWSSVAVITAQPMMKIVSIEVIAIYYALTTLIFNDSI